MILCNTYSVLWAHTILNLSLRGCYHTQHITKTRPGTPDCLSNGIQTRKANNVHCITLFETVGLELSWNRLDALRNIRQRKKGLGNSVCVHSVCLFVWIGPPTPFPTAVCVPQLACGGGSGRANLDDRPETVALCILCGTYSCNSFST
jgi:hypothetical protein